MTKKPTRTKPLDRDGDGHDGGSLPGNQTAPMAGDAAQPDRTFAIAARLFAREAPSTEVEAEVKRRAETIWGIDGFAIETRLGDLLIARAKPSGEPVSREPLRISEGDENVEASVLLEVAQELAIDHWGTSEYEVTFENGGAVARLHEGAQPWPEPERDDTFTPEEIAAGQTPVVEQEGDTTTAADQATIIDEADPLVTVETETAPIAVRLRELEILVTARRLYHSPQGYSSNYGAPFIDEATVKGWVAAGLAYDIPSAGNTGGVKLTAEARQVVNRLRREQAEAA